MLVCWRDTCCLKRSSRLSEDFRKTGRKPKTRKKSPRLPLTGSGRTMGTGSTTPRTCTTASWGLLRVAWRRASISVGFSTISMAVCAFQRPPCCFCEGWVGTRRHVRASECEKRARLSQRLMGSSFHPERPHFL